MIEAIIYDYLKNDAELNIYTEQPKQKPQYFYVMEKTAGGRTDHVNQSTLAIQSYAPTLYEAASMNETLKGIMLDAIKLDEVSDVQINSDYNYTDPTTKQYRYQAVFVISHY
jgi:hypothetical protein